MSDSDAKSPPAPEPAGPYSDDVARFDKQIILPRGGNISEFCLACAQPAAEQRTVKLRQRSFTGSRPLSPGNAGGLFMILYLLEMSVYLLSWIIESADASKRQITYGLCPRHAARRKLFFRSIAFCILASIGLFVFVFTHLNAPVYIGLPATILAGFFLIAPVFLSPFLLGPTLLKQDETYLWIKGAGNPFLARYVDLATKVKA